jgi:hypothetical protein
VSEAANGPDVVQAVEQHLREFFAGHAVTPLVWPVGPADQRLPGFRVLRIGPGPRTGQWVFASVGASAIAVGGRQELVLCAPTDDPVHLETVAMVATYHAGGGSDRLGLGHTVPIGRAWVSGSACSVLLISLPYPFGPDLERCPTPAGQVRVLWLLPITQAEQRFVQDHGLEALEQRFDDGGLEYWRPDRRSVI